MKIGFIGTGNMGSAIVRAYSGAVAAAEDEILLYNRTLSKAEALAAETGAEVAGSLCELTNISDLIFVCVEPKNYDEVMPQIADRFSKDKTLVSIAAGISISYLESFLGSNSAVIRAMPNTPIMYEMGATAMVRNANVSEGAFKAARDVFEAGGVTAEVSEDLISAVIGVSGSSPAYTYMYIDALIKAGIDAGLAPDMSRKFAAQTVMGAARMILESDENPSKLVERVCTPGGTTIEAVNKLRESNFEDIVKDGARAAINRSEEMSSS